jgi:DNA-binding response OmpR family regulator
MGASVLIIEDDLDIAELIAMYLGDEGIRSDIAASAEEGQRKRLAASYDLIVLDLGLPGMDGLEFLEDLRSSSDLPVVIVSSREADEDMILGLGLGADDFVGKPFSPRVLAARVKAHLRRAQGEGRRPEPGDVARIGDLSVDLGSMIVERAGRRVTMPARELDLLIYFIRHRGQALGSDEIYREVWGNPYGDVTTVAVHVQRLRRRIEPDPSDPAYIKTVYGVGYRFDAPVGGVD